MANPQVENGHLKIANEVWEHLILSGMTGAEFPIVMAVIRKSWGWKRKEAEISLAEFHSVTRQPERTIAHSLHSLTSKNILIQTAGGGRGHPSKWSFNKDWETWKTVQPIAEIKVGEINSAKINSVSYCSQTVQPIAEITAKDCRVYDPSKPATSLFPEDTIRENFPKATIKASKSKLGAKAPREKDQAYEIFRSEFLEHRKVPYQKSNGDFVRLSNLRKAFEINPKETPPGWEDSIHNYFGTPQGKYTLCDFCSRYDVFYNGKLDRFGKPPEEGVKTGRFNLHEHNVEVGKRFVARGQDDE